MLSFWTGVNTQKLQQSPQSLIIQEGDELTISCDSSESLYALHWYWQGDDGGPIFLVILQKGGDKKSNDKITAKLDEKMQRSSLHIRASQPSHSGTYLCATVHSGLQTSAGCLQTCSWATGALLT